jgi:hypothetical protein
MTALEDQFAIFLEHQKKYGRPIMSMSGIATGSMWQGIHIPGGPEVAVRRADEIMRAVMYVTGVSAPDFFSLRRPRHLTEARHLAYWFLRHYTSLSTPQIGRLIGGRDHATILHGVHRVKTRPRRFSSRINAIAQVLMVDPPREMRVQ